MSRKSILFALVLVVGIVFGLMVPTTAFAAVHTTCGWKADGPTTIVSITAITEKGLAAASERRVLEGHEVALADGTTLEAGSEVWINDRIERGILVNTSDQTLQVAFANGDLVSLEPGQELGIGILVDCECQCRCETGPTGASKNFNFPCDNNGDDCDYDGESCQWTGDGGVIKVGTLVDCKKVWIF